ncbi:RMD1 family protein [Altericista sp. CCNU0014]|uniref:RMD1 family protein n=1 Tax=Altericista sp. CCNU0014 TaxID=3082949 RepID=UPI00384A631D
MLSPIESSLNPESHLSLNSLSQELSTPLFSGVANGTPISIRSRFVGERLNLKTLETTAPLSSNPLLIRAGSDGCAVLFRYGVVVLFNLSAIEEVSFLENLKPLISEPAQTVVSEQIEAIFDAEAKERIGSTAIWLQDRSVERLQVVADIFAKSVILEYYENQIARLFERIRPFADAIQNQGVRRPKDRELLRQIGGTLLIQHKMVGIVEVGEKPDPLWERPDLERLYLRLEDEYELRERLLALERKLALVSRTAETALELMQHDSSHRVEWYIVALIVVEILLSVYELWLKKA